MNEPSRHFAKPHFLHFALGFLQFHGFLFSWCKRHYLSHFFSFLFSLTSMLLSNSGIKRRRTWRETFRFWFLSLFCLLTLFHFLRAVVLMLTVPWLWNLAGKRSPPDYDDQDIDKDPFLLAEVRIAWIFYVVTVFRFRIW